MANSEQQAGTGPSRGRLSVVATPIGNLSDMTERARAVLSACDLVAAEDTRHTRSLLRHFGIDKPLLSLHDHNESGRATQLLTRLQGGAHVALVSDAGTPAISDPGYRLVQACAQAGIDIEPVPGACAAIVALCVSGLPTDHFCFEGFLPAAGGARDARLRQLAAETRTLVFYESPHRIGEMLAAALAILGGERAAFIARELTKHFETLYRGTLAGLSVRAQSDPDMARGEIVVVIGGAPPPSDTDTRELDRVLNILLRELPLRQAADLGAQLVGCRANRAYKRALELQPG